jgi:lysophospholipase L1-like esterase
VVTVLPTATVAIALGVIAAGCLAKGADRAMRMLPVDCAAPVRYVALGDSTVEGIGASSPHRTYVAHLHRRLRAAYPNAEAENLGASGATSEDVIRTQLDRAVALHPDLVTLSVGPNDLTGGVTVEAYARNLDRILGRLAHETRAVVVVNLLPDLAVTPRFRGSDREESAGRLSMRFNEGLRTVAGRHGVGTVDLYAASREEVPGQPYLVASDGYHPSDQGYERWADLMWTRIERHVLC